MIAERRREGALEPKSGSTPEGGVPSGVASEPSRRPQSRGAPTGDLGSPAERLYQQALAARQAGDLPGAATSIKLALVFDPTNSSFLELGEEIAGALSAVTNGESPTARAAALFESAVREERLNKVDSAIAFLEQALELRKEARFYGRLGALLAQKHDVERGQELLEKAIALEPQNKTYRKNLEKITRSRSAAAEEKPAGANRFLGLLGKSR